MRDKHVVVGAEPPFGDACSANRDRRIGMRLLHQTNTVAAFNY